MLGGFDSLRTFQGTVSIFAGLLLCPRMCGLTIGFEECGGCIEIQVKGSIEIICELGSRCACVEALNTAVWDGRDGGRWGR